MGDACAAPAGGGGCSLYVEGESGSKQGMFAQEPQALTGSHLDERLSERVGDLIVTLRCRSVGRVGAAPTGVSTPA